MEFHANHALGLPQRLALVQAIERGSSLRAAAAALSVSPATAHPSVWRPDRSLRSSCGGSSLSRWTWSRSSSSHRSRTGREDRRLKFYGLRDMLLAFAVRRLCCDDGRVSWLVAAAGAICALLLALFGLVRALDVPVLSDESPDLGGAGIGAAVASFTLLAGDVLLPVPSSAVMVANGAVFGAVGGAALSFAGSVAGALLGFVLGRRGSALLARAVPANARARAGRALAQRGAAAIVVTRPLPVVAETVIIVASAAGMPLRRLAPAAAIGSLPPAVAYALAGSVAARFGDALLVMVATLALTVAVVAAERRRPGGAPSAHAAG